MKRPAFELSNITKRARSSPKCPYTPFEYTPYVREQVLNDCRKRANDGNRPPLRFKLMDTQTIYPPHDIEGWKRMIEASTAPSNVWRNTDTIVFRGRLETGRLLFGVIDGTYLPGNIQKSLNPICYFEARESFAYGTYPGLEEYGDQVFQTPEDRFFAWLYLQLRAISRENYNATMNTHNYEEEVIQNDDDEDDDTEQRNVKPPHPDNILGYSKVIFSDDIPCFKTLYGYVPDDWRPNGLVAVKLRSRKIAKQIIAYFESDTYLNAVKDGHSPTIRIFEATTFPLDQQWRFERNLNLGSMIKTNAHVVMEPKQGLYYFDVGSSENAKPEDLPLFIRVHYDSLTEDETSPTDTDNPKLEPVRLSFDIECESVWDVFLSKHAFPTARWTPDALVKRYRKLLDDKAINSIKKCKDVLLARSKLKNALSNTMVSEKDIVELCNAYPNIKGRIQSNLQKPLNDRKPDSGKNITVTQALADLLLPSMEARQKILAICFIVRRDEKSAEIMQSELGSFVYTWKPKNGFQKTSSEETLSIAAPFFKQTRYPNTQLVIFDDELSMIIQFLAKLRNIGPEVLQSYNGAGFDLPYILETLAWYSEFGSATEKQRIDRLKPSNIGFIRGFKSRWWLSSFARGGGMKQKTENTTSLITSMDLLQVLQNETFGKRMASYKLDMVAEQELVYPEGFLPMRKLEIRVTKGREMWINGGDDLIFFLSYCMVDALLPSLLAEKLAYDTMLYEVANLSGLTTSRVFSSGLSEKVVSLLAKGIYDMGKKFIVPDYGTRELHWPDLWLWNFDIHSQKFNTGALLPDPKWEDVRSLYENVPTLKRKWELSAIRLCKKSTYTTDDVRFCWSIAQRKEKQSSHKITEGKNYVGAHVMETIRKVIFSLLLTLDFTGMYPSIIMSHHLCYSTLVTTFTKKFFSIPESALFRCIMGPAKYSRCGDEYFSPHDAKKTDSPESRQVQTWWVNSCMVPHAPFPKILIFLTGKRKAAKIQMGNWDSKKCELTIAHYLANFPRNDNISEYAKKENDSIEKNVVVNQKKFGKRQLVKLQEQLKTLENESQLDNLISEWAKIDNLDTKNVRTIEKELKKAISWHINYDTKQGALKIFLNGSYGFTGMSSGKLSCLSLGGTVTAVGREIIKICQNVAENTDLVWLIREELKLEDDLKKYGVDLNNLGDKNTRPITLGGDTDSIFVNIPGYLVPSHAFHIGQKIGKWIVKKANTFTPRRKADENIPKKDSETQEEYDLQCLRTRLVPHIMALDYEKTGVASILIQQKNYMQLTPEMGFQMKGVASKKGDTLPFWSKIENYITKNILLKQLQENEDPQERIIKAVTYLHEQLWKPLRGEYDLDDFILRKVLRNNPDAYEKTSQQYRLISRQRELGKEVGWGDVLYWVYTEERSDGNSWVTEKNFANVERTGGTKARTLNRNKTIEMVSKKCYEEDPEYALQNGLELDIIYYYKHVVMKKAQIFMATLLNDHVMYPRLPYGSTVKEEEALIKQRKKFIDIQQHVVEEVIFPPEMRIVMANRANLKYQKNTNSMGWKMGSTFKNDTTRLAQCVLCNIPFFNNQEKNVFSGICQSCKNNKTKQEWLDDIQQHNSDLSLEADKCLKLCWECIKTTTVCAKPSLVASNNIIDNDPQSYVVSPMDCTKGHCSVFKKRQKINNRTIQNNTKIASISKLDW